jgi:hypothetical protein
MSQPAQQYAPLPREVTRPSGMERVFGRYQWVTAHLARRLGREVRVLIDAAGVEEPGPLGDFFGALVQAVRGAVEHGVESPGERIAAGKPEVATVTLGARWEGAFVVWIEDDGRGVDWERVAERGRSWGLDTSTGAGRAAALFSGRRLGGVVEICRARGGRAFVESRPGCSTRFTFVFPEVV